LLPPCSSACVAGKDNILSGCACLFVIPYRLIFQRKTKVYYFCCCCCCSCVLIEPNVLLAKAQARKAFIFHHHV
jgi:hypothetical protein